MSDELELNFDVVPVKSAAQKRQEKADKIAIKRHQQRKETREKQEATAYRKSKVGLLEMVHQANFAALSDEDKVVVQTAHLEASVNWSMLVDAIENIVSGNTDRAPFIDLVYLELKNISKSTGYPSTDTAANMDVEAFENQDDYNFKRFGKFSKIPGALWKNFLHWAWQWAQTHKEECDESVFAELSTLFARPERPPLPQPRGFTPLTVAEEKAVQATNEHLEQLRRKAVFDRIGETNVEMPLV